MPTVAQSAPEVFRFGRFRLEPGRRRLLAGEQPVVLSSRAFDVLLYLIERRDRVVTKDELLSAVWSGTVVEENNLAVQVSALRRALGDRSGSLQFIATVPGRGYRFVAAVEIVAPPSPLPVREDPEPLAPALPASIAVPPTVVAEAASRPPARRRLWLALPALAAILLLGLLAWRVLSPPEADPASPLSIAVLPFRNLSPDPQQEYLADAIADDLTTVLSHIPASRVIARASADIIKTHPAPTADIGRQLGVRYLLEGSVRPEGDNLHINAQLIEAATGAHLWARAFDLRRGDGNNMRADIVRNLAGALDFQLTQIAAGESLRDRPNAPNAYDLFHQARAIAARASSFASLVQAQKLLERAVAQRPDFADAWALLGWVLVIKVRGYADADSDVDIGHAREAVTRALALAARNPQAIAVKGLLLMHDGQCPEAEANFRAALAIDPNLVTAHTGLALCAWDYGKAETMMAEVKTLLALDPEGPETRLRLHWLGMISLILGKYQEAIEYLHRSSAGEADPEPGAEELGRAEWTHLFLIAATQRLGDPARAHALYVDYDRIWPHRTVWRLEAFGTRAQLALPGMKDFFSALADAGMPRFADESEKGDPAPARPPDFVPHFKPTPPGLPGGHTYTTDEMRNALRGSPTPLVIDVGRGAALLPNAARDVEGEAEHAPSVFLNRAFGQQNDRAARAGRPVIVAGEGVTDWSGYYTSIAFLKAGYPNVGWYRGGEEAWAKSGLPTHDARLP